MIKILYKFGFKNLVNKFLKEALLFAIKETFLHKQEIKELILEQIDKIADKTEKKLVEKVQEL